MAPLRVGTITFDWYPYEPRSLRQVEAVVDAGYEVDVICSGQPGGKRFEVYNGVRIYRMPISRKYGNSLQMTLFQWCSFLFFAGITTTWLHLKRRYDIVHVHNMPDFLVFAALIPRLFGAKIILDVQDVSPELLAAKVKGKGRLREIVIRLATWQERISIAFVHHVVTTGSIFEKMLMKRGVPKEKITNILNSANPRLFPSERRCPPPSESGKQNQPFIIMYHGTLAKRNGLDTAILALAIARPVVPQLRLDIQGNGDYLPDLKKLAIELGVNESVVFTDFSPAEKLVDFVLHGDVGIIPYGYDGFAEYVLPTKAYEYAWMHRPMIASDTPAIHAMFRSESIILCDPTKPESFAEAMVDLYQHPEKRERMIDNAAEDYTPYRWELMAERYQQLLRTLYQKQVEVEAHEEQNPVASNKF